MNGVVFGEGICFRRFDGDINIRGGCIGDYCNILYI